MAPVTPLHSRELDESTKWIILITFGAIATLIAIVPWVVVSVLLFKLGGPRRLFLQSERDWLLKDLDSSVTSRINADRARRSLPPIDFSQRIRECLWYIRHAENEHAVHSPWRFMHVRRCVSEARKKVLELRKVVRDEEDQIARGSSNGGDAGGYIGGNIEGSTGGSVGAGDGEVQVVGPTN